MTTILLQPSAAWWTKFAQIREYASIKDFHELLTVLAGLKPEDEDEATIQNAARLQREAEALRVMETFVTADTCQPSDLGTRCIISGGEVIEIGTQEGSDADIPF